MTGVCRHTEEANQTPHATSAGQHRDPASFSRGPGPAAVKAMNAGLHGAGLFALLTLARLGIAAGAPGSAAWASAATTTARHSE